MKISLNWIKEFVDLDIIAKKSLEHVVVGYIESLKKHPNADKLNIVQVNIGEKTVQIVCGGTNLKEKIYVPVALPGAILPGNFAIQTSKIRGEESNGMICAKEELKMGENIPREIWILNSVKKWNAGTPLLQALNLQNAYSPEELKTLLTHHTAEVEEIIHQDEFLHKVVTGKLVEFEKITGSEKLHKGIFDLGWKKVQIVFGSVHVINPGEIMPIALAGAKLPGGDINNSEFLGIKSEGMVCGNDELGIDTKGITRFPANTPLGKPIAEVLHLEDTILLIDNKSLTHRPDLWGHYGIARELAAITNKKLAPLKTEAHFPQTGTTLSLEVKDKKLCPRYIGVQIENLKIGESPQWLKNRLHAIGYRAISNIVDVTNYVMAELGQPLHAFDAAKINGGIIVRKAKKGEMIQTLDGTTRKLDSETLVIADHQKPLAIAGIMGGANSEVEANSTTIILEAANFNPSSVRKTSVRLGLRTEAVQRFEKSLDPLLTEQAMDRACELILKICPSAKISGPKVDVKNFNIKPITVSVDLKKLFSKIGKEIPSAEVIKILTSLEFKVEVKGKSKIKVIVPSFRATKDIKIEDDIVEEVARMHGYDNIEAKLPELPIKLPIENTDRKLKHLARQILALGLGFNEVYNYSFYSLKDIQKSLLPEEPHLKLQNYLSEDQTHLRLSLMPNLLKNVAHNLKFFDEFKIYEIGRTYEDLQEYFPIETKKITGVIVKSKKSKTDLFSEAKGALEEFLKQMHITGPEMRKGESLCPYAHPNKYAAYYLLRNGEEIGRVFEIHPLVAKNYELENVKIAAFEVNFTKIATIEEKTTTYHQLPKFPGIEFDISFIINKKTEIGTLQKMMQRANKTLIQEVKLFDIYEGSNIPADKKSLAFKIKLRAPDRTLTDQEMQETQNKILAELKKLGGEIRNSNK